MNYGGFCHFAPPRTDLSIGKFDGATVTVVNHVMLVLNSLVFKFVIDSQPEEGQSKQMGQLGDATGWRREGRTVQCSEAASYLKARAGVVKAFALNG